MTRGGFQALSGIGAVDERRTGPLAGDRRIDGAVLGGLVALGFGIAVRSGPRDRRGDRAERIGQIHAVQRRHRTVAGPIAAACGLPASISRACRRIACCKVRGIACTFQNLRLFPNPTVLENVMVGMHARLNTGLVGAVLRPPRTGREERRARERALEILSVFGNRLLPRVNHVVSSLSYANRRRAEISPRASPRSRSSCSSTSRCSWHEPGRDAGAGRTDQESQSARPVHRVDRAQARCCREPRWTMS